MDNSERNEAGNARGEGNAYEVRSVVSSDDAWNRESHDLRVHLADLVLHMPHIRFNRLDARLTRCGHVRQ